ncbi:MAG: tRNA uridine-5-carboxymethylaminomethyl(34) synthesis GTPase MnmE [Pseudomonadota bacterium]
MDTICALATAPGRAGVAVIRVSGPEAFSAGTALAGSLPDVGSHRVRGLRGLDGLLIDRALVLTFAGPNSFTGEDTVEFQVHGSTAGIAAVLDALQAIDDVRLAEPGEFTRRALQNGRMDLIQVEGLSDLIEAETQTQLRQALKTTEGGLSVQIEELRKDLIRSAALIEATIDFADEEVPTDVTPEVLALIDTAEATMRDMLAGSVAAERIRTGFEVAIVGPPNAGKSTLLNRLANREAAITSEVAGTTRDVIEVRMDIGGLAVTLLDTAGIRETDDGVEQLGVARGIQRAQVADLRICLTEDGSTPMRLESEDLVLIAKDDQGKHANGISGQSGYGIEKLVADISDVLRGKVSGASLASRERHRLGLAHALDGLALARAQIETGPDMYDIAAEELRGAIRQLETLVGRIGVEDLLSEIFASFCIGK